MVQHHCITQISDCADAVPAVDRGRAHLSVLLPRAHPSRVADAPKDYRTASVTATTINAPADTRVPQLRRISLVDVWKERDARNSVSSSVTGGRATGTDKDRTASDEAGARGEISSAKKAAQAAVDKHRNKQTAVQTTGLNVDPSSSTSPGARLLQPRRKSLVDVWKDRDAKNSVLSATGGGAMGPENDRIASNQAVARAEEASAKDAAKTAAEEQRRKQAQARAQKFLSSTKRAQ